VGASTSRSDKKQRHPVQKKGDSPSTACKKKGRNERALRRVLVGLKGETSGAKIIVKAKNREVDLSNRKKSCHVEFGGSPCRLKAQGIAIQVGSEKGVSFRETRGERLRCERRKSVARSVRWDPETY